MVIKNLNIQKFTANPQWISRGSYSLLVICALLSTLFTFFLYKFTENLLSERLYERLRSVVATASLNIHPEEISLLLSLGPENSLKTDVYKDVVQKLRAIKDANPDITFAYIYSKTDDPNTVDFVADADVIAIIPELNYNEDEMTDEGFPGSPFNVSEIGLIRDGIVFNEAVVDRYFYDTVWGTLMTAYSPLPSMDGQVNAVLGIDVEISDYRRLAMATLVPFAIFVIFLLSLLTVLTVSLVRMWGSRVELFKELDRQKDELLGIVSHQLATPISALKWDIEMLLDGDFGALKVAQKEFIRKLQGVSGHLSDLASMILDVSRIQLGKMQADRTALNLREFFDEEITLMKAKAEQKKIHLKISIGKEVITGNLDKRLMRMIVQNLLSNAIKYTPDGGIVSLNAEIKNRMLHLEVSDTGCGIPKKDQSKIFGKLFRASNVRNVDGNGFGLFVVKGAVEAQQGMIKFDSEQGKGTTFNIEMPLVDSDSV
jgi:signal transduction histidine kinase